VDFVHYQRRNEGHITKKLFDVLSLKFEWMLYDRRKLNEELVFFSGQLTEEVCLKDIAENALPSLNLKLQ